MKEGQQGGGYVPLAIEVISGLTSGVSQTIVGHPLEIIKTRLQSEFLSTQTLRALCTTNGPCSLSEQPGLSEEQEQL